MVLKILFFILLLLPMNTSLQAGLLENVTNYFRKPTSEEPPKLKILLAHDKHGVVLEAKGKYKIFNPLNGELISTRFTGKRKFIQSIVDGLKWGEEFPGIYQLAIIPDDIKSTTIVDGIEYRGPIYVYDIGGTISVINQVYIEDYLSSILSPRYRQALQEEVLNAIAIAARTTAYYYAENPKSPYWSVDGSQLKYEGFAASNQSSAVEKAIKDTRHMIMSLPQVIDRGLHPFIAKWESESQDSPSTVVSEITLMEAETMAQKGAHAAQILSKGFPGVKIELVH